MKLNEFFSESEGMLIENFVTESAVMAWGKSGNEVIRKFRCTAGRRKGRLVSTSAGCSSAIDPEKRQRMRRLMAKMGKKIARKAKRTKRVNPISKKVAARNKSARN